MRGGNNSDAHSCLVRAVADYLDCIKAWHFKVLGGLGQKAGISDFIACVQCQLVYEQDGRTVYDTEGRFVAIECKTGSSQLSAKQREVKADIIRAGGVFLEVRRIEDLELGLLDAELITRRLLT